MLVKGHESTDESTRVLQQYSDMQLKCQLNSSATYPISKETYMRVVFFPKSKHTVFLAYLVEEKY